MVTPGFQFQMTFHSQYRTLKKSWLWHWKQCLLCIFPALSLFFTYKRWHGQKLQKNTFLLPDTQQKWFHKQLHTEWWRRGFANRWWRELGGTDFEGQIQMGQGLRVEWVILIIGDQPSTRVYLLPRGDDSFERISNISIMRKGENI